MQGSVSSCGAILTIFKDFKFQCLANIKPKFMLKIAIDVLMWMQAEICVAGCSLNAR